MRSTSILILVCAVTGCQTDYSTTTPTKEQIQYCREVMYLNPDVEITPLGFFLQPGMDDTIRFKFIAQTNDPSKLFDGTHVDSTQFKTDFHVYALQPDAPEKWWDVSAQSLTGENFSVPPPNSTGTRGLNIGYIKNADGTLTVYVLWHET